MFVSGSFAFDTERHTSTWWGGFALSNQTSTVFESYADQFKSAVGSGHNSANYAVVYSYTGANYAANVTNAADGADVLAAKLRPHQTILVRGRREQ